MTAAPMQGPTLGDAGERRPAILIVEDEILIRLVVSNYLQECGCKTFEAGSATEAIEILQIDQAPIDLVFSDVHLSGHLSGIDLAKWIRDHHPEKPVVLTSGDPRKAQKAMEFCMEAMFFAKPYDFDEMWRGFQFLLDLERVQIT